MKPLDHDFLQWLKHARPGDRHIYHKGFLLRDRWTRIRIPGVGYVGGIAEEPTTSLALAAMTASDGGVVCLVQQKIGPSMYYYIAVKR